MVTLFINLRPATISFIREPHRATLTRNADQCSQLSIIYDETVSRRETAYNERDSRELVNRDKETNENHEGVDEGKSLATKTV